MEPTLKLLSEKYMLMAQAKGEAVVPTQKTELKPQEVKLALDWKTAGLYEPENPLDQRNTQAAIKELTNILDLFDHGLQAWQHKYTSLGATDTMSKETVAQYISQSILGITKLD